jgi:hypothetical protein
MGRKSEDQLQSWTGPASDAEQERYDWTKNQISESLTGGGLGQFTFKVYPKGSYPNHTNVVRDSDVDIAVELTDISHNEFIHSAKGLTIHDFGYTPYTGSYDLKQFKDDVEAALRRQFGAAVDRGNKAIHIRESSRGLKADVVVCQTLRSHVSRATIRPGILIQPDQGDDIHNFPKHHLDEGVIKNNETQKRYKSLVRIVKRLENEMVENGLIAEVPSFLMESMVWNVPKEIFTQLNTWEDRLAAALLHIRRSDKSDWLEANNVKFLFRKSQKWTEEEAQHFVNSSLRYLEFIQCRTLHGQG